MDNRQTRAAWWGTVVLFLVHGLVVSTWISRIPAVQIKLHLNNFVLGLTLLSSAIGAMCAIPIAGNLVGKLGTKRVAVWASVGLCVCLVLPALAVNAATLAVALFIYGAWAAAMGVAMNSQAVEVENALKKPTMSRFHAMFSLGAMAGAAVGGAVAARGYGTVGHFAVSGAVNGLAILAISGMLLETHDAHKNMDHRLPFSKMPRVLLALSAIAFCMFLSEGAMADWIALYLRQVLKADQGTAAYGYSVFAGAMATMRLLGDIVTARLGSYRAVRNGSLLAALGVIWALCVREPLWAMPGFGLAGCGFSIIVPLVFSAAGRVKGVSAGAGIATVSGIAYLAFIAGPPAIGFLSQVMTLRGALLVVVGCCLLSAVLSMEIKRQ
jgi:predicted MFS family arabinose efflux permease